MGGATLIIEPAPGSRIATEVDSNAVLPPRVGRFYTVNCFEVRCYQREMDATFVFAVMHTRGALWFLPIISGTS